MGLSIVSYWRHRWGIVVTVRDGMLYVGVIC